MANSTITEYQQIEGLFNLFTTQEICSFPRTGQCLVAPLTQGVYIIRNATGKVLHVGRTLRGKKGLRQRLDQHLAGNSSFVQHGNLKGDRAQLRTGFTFQYLAVDDPRQRALLECFAIARLCPEHLGEGGMLKKIPDRLTH